MKIEIGEEIRRYSVEYVELNIDMDEETEQILYDQGLRMLAKNRQEVVNYAVVNALKNLVEKEEKEEKETFCPCDLCSQNTDLPLCPSCSNNKRIIEKLQNEAESTTKP